MYILGANTYIYVLICTFRF